MKIKGLALTLCLVLAGAHASAQSANKYATDNRHEIRIGYSDALSLGVASFWGMGLGDAVTGTTRTDERTAGMVGLGYRYSLNRFRVGLDLGFASWSSKRDHNGSKQKDIKETQLNFVVMPVGELVYYKRGALELYGSVAAGVDVVATTEKGLTELGRQHAYTHARTTADFAFQVNPIALRLGNDRVGGFVEAGVGSKGFCTVGLSLRL